MLLKGLGSMYRNPTAHDPRLRRPVTDEELLELLTSLSMIHRRLDHARVQP
ncbi:TIGR02391 family protein [Streptomyces cinerochromogenes]|uniref:TIGR02391 family protein n=1 Tax=Streptomyces cinerochromogenes TaxID=66422 RepID=UPI0033BF1493